MNLLARLLSHGFAVAIVAFLIIGFMYRGELFPELEMPEFLGLNKGQEETAKSASPDDGTHADAGAPAAVGPADTAPGAVSDEAPDAAAAALGDVAEPGRTAGMTDFPGSPQIPAGTKDEPDRVTETVASPAERADSARTAAEALTSGSMPAGRSAAIEPATAAPSGAESADRTAETDASPGTTAMPRSAAITGSTQWQGGAPTPVSGPAGADGVPMTTPPMGEPGSTAVPSAPADAQDSTVAATGLQAPAGTTGTDATASPYQLLAAARESFWLRDYSGAERQYRQLIDIEPDNPDGYGELGNMYFSQGNWDEAASAYYEAGTRLITAGNLSQARDLAEVIRGLDGERADDLEQLIDAEDAAP